MAKKQRRKRRKFSDKYKAETVRLIHSIGKSVGQMALELDIGKTALSDRSVSTLPIFILYWWLVDFRPFDDSAVLVAAKHANRPMQQIV